MNKMECFVFNSTAPYILGEELYAKMVENKQTPTFYNVSQINGEAFCRRMYGRASYISAMLVGLVTKSGKAAALTMALGKLLVDCETCCKEGWGSENCLIDLKALLKNACQQDLLEDL